MAGQLVPVVQAARRPRDSPATARHGDRYSPRLAHSREIARNKYPRRMAGYARQSRNYRGEPGKRRTAVLVCQVRGVW